MESKFETDLSYGEIGEKVFQVFIKMKPSTKNVIDARRDPYFQNRDIDFLVERNDHQVIKYEIKTDSMADNTGNIVWETKSSPNSDGCMVKCEADWVFYYLPNSQIAYLFHVDSMRQFISERKTELRETPMGDHATGYLLPIDELLEHNILVKCYGADR